MPEQAENAQPQSSGQSATELSEVRKALDSFNPPPPLVVEVPMARLDTAPMAPNMSNVSPNPTPPTDADG
jgi:hypothetical protein